MTTPDPSSHNPPFSGETWTGRIISGARINRAIISTIERWQAYYLNVTALQEDVPVDQMSPIRGLRISTDMEAMPEDKRPLLILVNNGLADPPVRSGLGSPNGRQYSGVWEFDLGIEVVARGQREDHATRAIQSAWRYMAAIRTLLIQQRDEERVIAWTDWINEEPGGLDSDADRTACLVTATFNVSVSQLSSWGTGPLDPDWMPPELPLSEEPEWPVVTDPSADVSKEPPDTP